jgi:ubiquinol-cytochrome c reductase cytochrome b subunit
MAPAEPAPLCSLLDRALRPVGTTLGQLAFAALAVVVATGIALGALYDAAEPLASLEAIQGGIPYGFLIRAAHHVSAQVFTIALLLHTLDHVCSRSYRVTRAATWWQLVGVAALCVGAMFSGYLLRGDASADAARSIAAATVESLPGVGTALSAFLLGGRDGSLAPVLSHHVVTFTLLPWLLALAHARRTWAGGLLTLVMLAAVTALSLVLRPGLGGPPGTAEGTLWGPWYFIGVQELLRHLPLGAAVAGVTLALVLPLGLLGHLPAEPRPQDAAVERLLRPGVIVATAAYLLLCLLAYGLRGAA